MQRGQAWWMLLSTTPPVSNIVLRLNIYFIGGQVMYTRALNLVIVVTLMSFCASASANGESAQDLRTMSITISPIHLTLPLVEVTGEYQLTPQMSAACIGGAGSITDAGSDYLMYELGTQFRYYVWGDFDHGLQLGAEILYIGVSTDDSEGDVALSGSADGLAIGPFVGYKFTAGFGLTIDIQAGYQFLTMQAEAEASSDDMTVAETDEAEDGIPLININFGWSF